MALAALAPGLARGEPTETQDQPFAPRHDRSTVVGNVAGESSFLEEPPFPGVEITDAFRVQLETFVAPDASLGEGHVTLVRPEVGGRVAWPVGERFLLREPGSATRMLFESWLQEQGLTLGATLQMASNEAIRVGVASGMGLAVLSEHVLPPEHPDLVILPVTGLPIESHWQFIVRRDRRLPHAALGLLRFAEGHLGECVEARFLCNEIPDLLAGLEMTDA